MYPATEKTRLINKFRRQRVIKARDLYAKYGERFNVRAIHGTDASTPTDVIPEGQSVISSMVSAQNILRNHAKSEETDK